MVLCVCVGGGGVCVRVFCLVVCYIEVINGTEVLVWLRCVSHMLTIDHSF